jgi:hypothetical protein
MAAGVVLVASLCSATAAAEARAPRVTAIPYTPGAFVWYVAPPPALKARKLGSCDRVPASGFLGSGVYSQSGTHVSGSWSWGASTHGEPFHWYIVTPGGTIVANARSEGAKGSSNVPSASYYWKVQNLGNDPQAWNVCY